MRYLFYLFLLLLTSLTLTGCNYNRVFQSPPVTNNNPLSSQLNQKNDVDNTNSETEKMKQEIENLKSQLDELKTKSENNKNQNLENIIKLWQQRIFQVTCFFKYANASEIYLVKQGSGFMGYSKDGYILITNKHVARDGEYAPYYCNAESANKQIKFRIENKDIRASEIFDTAGMKIFTDKIISENFSYPFCDRSKINIGTKVLVLGYPGIGTQIGITATEGIISGIEDYYFVTSAKIDEGSSGGAAISTENNCYIGIPTMAEVGEIESLGRILDFKRTMNVDIQN